MRTRASTGGATPPLVRLPCSAVSHPVSPPVLPVALHEHNQARDANTAATHRASYTIFGVPPCGSKVAHAVAEPATAAVTLLWTTHACSPTRTQPKCEHALQRVGPTA